MLNISGTTRNDDPTFRYKMPRLECKIEGRGNGIKTVVTNLAAIADALGRPPSWLTKFFGTELGAQSQWDTATGRAVVNGAHDAKPLQRLVHVFVDAFVLCPKCHLPETELVVSVRRDTVRHRCAACGAVGPVDRSQRLCTFILNQAASALAAAHGADAPARGGADTAGRGANAVARGADAAARGADTAGRSADAATAARGANPTVSTAATVVDWHMDTSASAVEARRCIAHAVPTPTDPPVAVATTSDDPSVHPDTYTRRLQWLLDGSCTLAAARAVVLSELQVALRRSVPVEQQQRRTLRLLHALYDADVLDEDAVQAWASSPSADACVVAWAKPFLEWLTTAEEEE